MPDAQVLDGIHACTDTQHVCHGSNCKRLHTLDMQSAAEGRVCMSGRYGKAEVLGIDCVMLAGVVEEECKACGASHNWDSEEDQTRRLGAQGQQR